jgi:hypothetical protein
VEMRPALQMLSEDFSKQGLLGEIFRANYNCVRAALATCSKQHTRETNDEGENTRAAHCHAGFMPK